MSLSRELHTARAYPARRNNLAEAVRRYGHNKMAVLGLVIITGFVSVAILAPVIAPYEPDSQRISDRLQPPSRQYLMGTDKLGRDVFSRAIMATRVSLPIGLLSMLISMVLGIGFGVMAGYFGGLLGNVLMRVTDLFLSFPTFFITITISALFGPDISTIILMLGFTSWASTARIMRGVALSIREATYVEAARAIGATNRRIIVRHVLVNSLSVIMVTATLTVAYAILVEGALSYLGLGVQPPTPSWGNMMADGRDVLRVAWWPSMFPGLLLMLVVISFNLIGDGLRDFFDPVKRS